MRLYTYLVLVAESNSYHLTHDFQGSGKVFAFYSAVMFWWSIYPFAANVKLTFLAYLWFLPAFSWDESYFWQAFYRKVILEIFKETAYSRSSRPEVFGLTILAKKFIFEIWLGSEFARDKSVRVYFFLNFC